jgi:hypothetical protein
MASRSKDDNIFYLLIVGLFGWLIPGGGHLILGKNKHAIIIFVTIFLTFGMGLYIGSVGVINSVNAKPWFLAQLMNSPVVIALAYISKVGGYAVYARPNEIGQIYTSIAGLLNLLCIVNAVYWAHLRRMETVGD